MDTQKKAALKMDYKLRPQDAGVFKIVNCKTGKLFVGSSMNLRGAFNRYRTELRLGSCRIPELQNDWTVIGEESFSFDVVEAVEPRKGESAVRPDDLKTCTELWLLELRPYGESGYNKDVRTAIDN
jgi:hypothetical protein